MNIKKITDFFYNALPDLFLEIKLTIDAAKFFPTLKVIMLSCFYSLPLLIVLFEAFFPLLFCLLIMITASITRRYSTSPEVEQARIASLLESCSFGNEHVRDRVHSALRSIALSSKTPAHRQEQIIAGLLSLLKHPDKRISNDASDSLLFIISEDKIPTEQLFTILLPFLRHDDSGTVKQVLLLIDYMVTNIMPEPLQADVIEALWSVLDGNHEESISKAVCDTLLLVIENDQTPAYMQDQCLSTFQRLLSHSDPYQRASATALIKQQVIHDRIPSYKREQTLVKLLPLLHDPDEVIAEDAALAVRTMVTSKSTTTYERSGLVTTLLPLLIHRSIYAAQAATATLRIMTESENIPTDQQQQVLTSLRRLLNSSDEVTRNNAELAIKNIEASQPTLSDRLSFVSALPTSIYSILSAFASVAPPVEAERIDSTNDTSSSSFSP